MSLITVLFLVSVAFGLPIPRPQIEEEDLQYLEDYGYLSETTGFADDGYTSVVKKFQQFAGLKQTGVIDSRTKEGF